MPYPKVTLITSITLSSLLIPSWGRTPIHSERDEPGLNETGLNESGMTETGMNDPGLNETGRQNKEWDDNQWRDNQWRDNQWRDNQWDDERILALPLDNWINDAVLRPSINPMTNADWCVADADYDVFVPGLFGGLLQLDCSAVNLNNRPLSAGNTPGEQAGITGRGTLEAKCIVTARNIGFSLHASQFLDDQKTFFTPLLLDSTYLYHSNKPAWLVEAMDIDRARGVSLDAKPGHYQLKVRGYAENHQHIELKMRIFVVREALPAGPPATFYKLGEREIPSKQTALYTFSETFDGIPRWNPIRQSNEFKVAIHLQKRADKRWIHHAGPIFASCEIE